MGNLTARSIDKHDWDNTNFSADSRSLGFGKTKISCHNKCSKMEIRSEKSEQTQHSLSVAKQFTFLLFAVLKNCYSPHIFCHQFLWSFFKILYILNFPNNVYWKNTFVLNTFGFSLKHCQIIWDVIFFHIEFSLANCLLNSIYSYGKISRLEIPMEPHIGTFSK